MQSQCLDFHVSMDEKFESEVTRNVLKRVRQLEIKTNRLLDQSLMGSYRSIFKGQGIEFEEVREYMPGDDIRLIDWNITAKFGSPFIKKFREDRELTMMLAVDISGSLDFGSTYYSKREVITELASLLAFSATRNNDKVGLLLFSDKIEKFIPPLKGRKHVLRIIRDLLFYEPENIGTRIGDAMHYLNKIIKKHSIVFLLSDFLQTQIKDVKNLTNILEITNRRHDLVCLQVEDQMEMQFSNAGIVALEDQETGEIIICNAGNKSFQNLYKINKLKYQKVLEEKLKRSGINFLKIKTDENYIRSLDKFLKKRVKI